MKIVILAAVFSITCRPALAQTGSGSSLALARIESVTPRTDEAFTRIVIRLSKETDFDIKEVPIPDSTARKLFVSFDRSDLGAKAKGPLSVSDGRVRKIAASQLQTRARIVIELAPETEYRVSASRETLQVVIFVRQKPSDPSTGESQWHAAPKGEPLFQLSGSFKQETAYHGGPGALTKVKNILTLGATGHLASWLSYKASGRGYYDGVFALNRQYPQSVANDQRAEDELRDTYIDLSLGDFDARLGRQQIVWGEAVGAFVADIVNPKDFREFILPDFDQIRVPQWAADLEYTIADTHIEAVYLPETGIDRMPLPGSEFPLALAVPPNTAVVIDGARVPPTRAGNGEWGGRLSQVIGGWDISGFGLRSWDFEPTPFRTLKTGPMGQVAEFQPEETRLNQGGGSFSKDLGPAVFKGEGVFDGQRLLPVTDPTNVKGVVPKDTVDYLLGLDFTPGGVNMNFQFMQRVIPRYENDLFMEERLRTQGSVWLKTGFWDNRVEPELLVVGNLKHSDWMIRPKIGFNVGGHWRFATGLDIFEGQSAGLFGQYQTKSRVYGELKLFF